MKCPICDRENDRDARRCRSCGADFEDPDIAAQLDRPRLDEDEDGEIDLSGGRYLGVRWIGLEVGGDLRRLALIGGILFAVVALLPVKFDVSDVQASWNAMDRGPHVALALPFILAAIGIVLATPVGRGLPPVALAGVLTVAGAVTLPLGFPKMGEFAGTPTHTLWLPWFGTAIAAAGVVLRVLRRKDPYARWIIVGGAVLVLIGMVLPHGDARGFLPFEFRLYVHRKDLADSGLISAWLEGYDSDSMVRFLSLWHLFELVLLGLAVAFAMRPSTGPWDSAGLVLRPLGFVLVFHLTLTLALYAFNVMAWSAGREVYRNWDDAVTALFAGRGRLALLSVPAMMWLVSGLVGLYAHLAPKPAVASGR